MNIDYTKRNIEIIENFFNDTCAGRVFDTKYFGKVEYDAECYYLHIETKKLLNSRKTLAQAVRCWNNYSIRFNKIYLKVCDDIDEILNTCVHELAHIFCMKRGINGHGREWYAMANAISRILFNKAFKRKLFNCEWSDKFDNENRNSAKYWYCDSDGNKISPIYRLTKNAILEVCRGIIRFPNRENANYTQVTICNKSNKIVYRCD